MKIRSFRRVLALVMALVMVLGMLPGVARAADADDASRDIPLSVLKVSTGDYEPDGGANEGPAELAVDNDPNTLWHTDWYGTSNANHWFQFELTEEYVVDGLRCLPRQTGNTNGIITKYEIQVSDDGETFETVATGDWAADRQWKLASFEGRIVKYVRLVSLEAVSDVAYVLASAAEIRLTGLAPDAGEADKTELNALIAECEQMEQGSYTNKSWQKLQAALEKARAVAANEWASQTQVDEALENLRSALEGLEESTGEGIQKIFHLDNGRKFFSKDWIIALLNELDAAGYTHLQLAFGNNGFRFLLDDMTIEANDTTYASDDIKAGIKLGNANYYDEGDVHALTEAEMDEILAHAAAVGVQIVPHLNMPGHMSALLDAMEYVGITDAHFTGYVESDSSVNLNNEAALNFMFALTDKYAAYFSEAGCKYFHIGADEYANDAYYGNMGFPSMGAALYQKFADFVNANAAIVESYGMTPRAWNDGISYGSYTSEFDSDIEINYWSSGWWGYNLAKASTLDANGHGLINTNGDYYYILGKDDRFTPGSSDKHDPNLYTECAGFDVTYFMDGSTIEDPVGGMFCVWCDYPGAETEQEVAENIRLVLRAMALRMDDMPLDSMDTGVVEGGFNEDGSINGEPAHEHEWSDWTETKAPTCTEAGEETRSCECGETETREVEALGHDYVNGECSRCDAVLTSKFEDVEAGDFFFDPVEWAVEKGITTGKTETLFDPEGECQRATVVTFLWRAAGEPEPTITENPFSDVKESHFFYKAVLWAVEEGITNGLTTTTFGPYENCNRAQVVTFLHRAMKTPEPTTAENPFSDVEAKDFFYDAVLWAVENNITNGLTATTFAPDTVCNRAQVVTFLYRTYN